MASLTTAAVPAPRFRKVLHGLDMMLFSVCAILIIDQLAASAAIGVQSIFWWLLTLVLFFIPYGLITAELGSTYPQEGGIYAWVRRAFGPRWAGRTAWLWWANVAFWMPSTYILFAGVAAELFAPDMTLWTKIIITFVLIWVTVGINIVTLDVGKWVPNIGAIFKVAVMLTIGIGGVVFALRHGVANEFSLATLRPNWGDSLAFLPVIVYNYLGFELMSGAGEEMENPARDVPRAIVSSGAIIAFLYVFATVGILLALPAHNIGLISGLTDTFRQLFGGGRAGDALVIVLGAMALYSFVANMVTWTIGANRSAAEAAGRGDLPAIFARLHPKFKTPAASAILGGVIGSLVLLVYGWLSASAEDLFWTTFAFSSVVFLLPYLLLFLSFLKLRRIDAALPRPYRVPGGYGVAVVLSIICMAFIAESIVFLIYKPGKFDLAYALAVGGGSILTVLVGELLVRGRRHLPSSES
ncbi:APC family permease [Polymorphobacter arshaanensis]|uniref:APC family permease n=1 Tax=Glacieibacterium arshaanense TaxID=2511025 RepID=A0A4Y9EQK1_9SPHN|nr:APC family permease [Polymorphobacter arshaanensis]TFU05876.1 APC family permease [Polymorphobacter arshaanensis]